MGGAHLTLGGVLMEEAEREGLKERPAFVIGGGFLETDAAKLQEIGFDKTFMPGPIREEIPSSIRKIVSDKRVRSV